MKQNRPGVLPRERDGYTLWMLRGKRLWDDLNAVRKYADPMTFRAYLQHVVLESPAIFSTKTLVPADRRMKGRACTFTPLRDRSIALDGIHFSGAREMYCRRVYFRVPGFEIRPQDSVVDVGANRGLFTTMAAIYGRRVLAIEAQSALAEAICENLERNRCREKAIVEVALVGDSSGLLRTSEAQANHAVWASRPAVVSMSELLGRHGFEHVDLMKIDIEGSEFTLLTKEQQWLDRVDRIVMEVHMRVGGDLAELTDTLGMFGFEVVITEAHSADPVTEIRGDGGYIFATKLR
jgi:FkbM family methyltransferase